VEVNDAVSEPAFIEQFEKRADVGLQGAIAPCHYAPPPTWTGARVT
jgi:hypothetical protein